MGNWNLMPDPDRPGELKWAYDANAASPTAEIRPHTQAVLDTIHGDAAPPRPGDVGDWIDPNAPDPTPDEVTDRADPNYVDPWFGP
jgi:hypothetical protein